ncbi:hypothetical protein BDZ45DRAFT_88980 [Acephala macrosclerotiorum]|nr:hypothetical protein BDZ45DRAFT_88980 [Acephala macrosclerotiorum]
MFQSSRVCNLQRRDQAIESNRSVEKGQRAGPVPFPQRFFCFFLLVLMDLHPTPCGIVSVTGVQPKQTIAPIVTLCLTKDTRLHAQSITTQLHFRLILSNRAKDGVTVASASADARRLLSSPLAGLRLFVGFRRFDDLGVLASLRSVTRQPKADWGTFVQGPFRPLGFERCRVVPWIGCGSCVRAQREKRPPKSSSRAVAGVMDDVRFCREDNRYKNRSLGVRGRRDLAGKSIEFDFVGGDDSNDALLQRASSHLH